MKAAACLGCKLSIINRYSIDQKRAQQIAVISLCTLSIILAIISLYFLLRIKRSFRHMYVTTFSDNYSERSSATEHVVGL